MRREQTARPVEPAAASVATQASKPPVVRKRDVIASLRQPKVAVMLILGFSSGSALSPHRQHPGLLAARRGHDLGAIGFLSWVGLALLAQVSVGADHRSRGRAALRPIWPPSRLDDCSAQCWSRPGLLAMSVDPASHAGSPPSARSRLSWRSPRPRRTSSWTRGASRRRTTPTSSGCCRPRISSAIEARCSSPTR